MGAEEAKKTLWFNDFVIDGEDIIFASGSFNGLFRANFKTGISYFLGCFPGEAMWGHHLYCGTYKYENHILFIPAWGNQFWIYNILNNSFEMLKVKTLNAISELLYYKYYGSIQIGKYVYVFGSLFPEILRIDMEKLEIKYYEGWLEELCKIGKKEKSPFFNKNVCLVGNSIFAVSGQNNSIIELNIENDRIQMHPIGEKGIIYDTLAYDGRYFWVTERAKRIVKIDKENWNCQFKEIEYKSIAQHFLDSTMMNDELWLFSDKLGSIVKICCNDFSLKELSVSYGEIDILYPNDNAYNFYFMKKITETELAFFCAQDCQLHIFNQIGEHRKIKFLWENATKDYYSRVLYNMPKVGKVIEGVYNNIPACRLGNFIDLVNCSGIVNNSMDKALNNGEYIYNLCEYGDGL